MKANSQSLQGLLETAQQLIENFRKAEPAPSPSTAPPKASAAAPSSLAPLIDHTLLNAEATRDDVIRLCSEARANGFATVCINPCYLALAAKELQGAKTVPITVVGFPLGASTSASKAFEAREAIQAGAREIDMVINIGALKSRDYEFVYRDIEEVVEASAPYPVKVIIETASLNREEKIIACVLSKGAGAAFVKTSTGFGTGGATVEDIRLIRKVVGPDIGVKASGGIRTYQDAVRMLEAGANRIGSAASVAIVSATSSKRNGLY